MSRSSLPPDHSLQKAQSRLYIKRLLLSDGRLHAKSYALAFVFMAMVAACTALAAYLMKDVVNEVFIKKDLEALWWIAGTIVGIYLVKGFATFGQNLILARIGSSIIANYQRKLYDHLLNQGLGYFADKASSDFLARLTYAAQGARDVLQIMVVSVGRDALSLIGLAIVMMIQDPALGAMALVALPIGALTIGQMVRRMVKFARRGYDGTSHILGLLQESVQGLKVIKAFNLEPVMRQRMLEGIEVVRRSTNKLMAVSASASPVSETLGGLVVALVIVVGGFRVIEGGETPGTFFSFITALLLAYEPAKRLGRLKLEIQNGLVGVSMLFEVLDQPAREERDEQPALQVTRGDIVFDDVSFAYREQEPVLQSLSFRADAGKITALVGSSGGGKSTVLSLLMRFFEPNCGRILIDGQDIACFSRASVRDAIALVSQDVFLFRGTIAENIRFGHFSATFEDIVAAAKTAQAHDFIMKLSHGYETDVGELGSQLSGGQRQRLAIARALLKNAPIILLDEATAALDNASEKQVQEALAELMKGRTTISVAHRLGTISHAGQILVIDHGRVVEAGTREELLGQHGHYHRLESLGTL